MQKSGSAMPGENDGTHYDYLHLHVMIVCPACHFLHRAIHFHQKMQWVITLNNMPAILICRFGPELKLILCPEMGIFMK
jgi:hypothetical protein